MRIGIDRRLAAIALWALAGAYGVVAVLIYKWPHSMGYPLMAIGGLSWIILLIIFLRIPSTDSVVAKG